MIQKVARTLALAGAIFDPSSRALERTAQYVPPSSLRSYYLDGATRLDVSAMLERFAPRYALSTDSRDYLYEAIRANTVQPPNENSDAFLRSEMLRHDRKIGRRVYATYISKPHHLNHKTDIAIEARGIILDAHYNDASPPLASCPQCNLKTADRANRDESGLHCKRCNRLVKDEFVEILLGVDTKKDPPFAEGVRTGALATGSMGCTCLYTTCNVCTHVATTKPEFCEHIRAGKGQLYTRQGSDWVRTSNNDVTRELAKRGHRFIPNDFTWTRFDDGYEVRRAFEACGDVTYDEYSRVAQPADPKARQQEVLRMQLRTAARTKVAPTGRAASPMGQDADVRIQAPPDESVTIEPPTDGSIPMGTGPGTGLPGEPGLPGGPGGAAPGAPGAPPPQAPGMAPPGTPPPVGAGSPGGGVPIEQLQRQPGRPPQPAERMSPAEMGVGVPGASRDATQRPTPRGATMTTNATPTPVRSAATKRFASVYAPWAVRVALDGKARITDANQRDAAYLDFGTGHKAEHHTNATGVFASLQEVGLVATVQKYAKRFGARVATSVVDGAIDDMEGFEDKELHGTVTDERTTDMVDPLEAVPSSVLDDRVTDMGEPRDETPTSTTGDGIADFDRGKKPPKSVVDEEHPDNQSPRRGPGPSSVLENEEHDFDEKVAGLVHRAHPEIVWSLMETATDTKGRVTAMIVKNATHGARTLSGPDLKHRAFVGASAEAAPDAALKVEARLKALFEAREAELVAKHMAEVATLCADAEAEKHAAIGAYQRAMRLLSKRFAVGLEPAPVRIAMETALTTGRVVGVDAATRQPIPFEGMSPKLAQYIAAEAYALGGSNHLEALMERAALLVQSGGEYLAAAEQDAAGFRAEPIQLSASEVAPISYVALAAADARQAAMRGNMTVTPAPPAIGFDPQQQGRHTAIANAVSNTTGAMLLQRLTPVQHVF